MVTAFGKASLTYLLEHLFRNTVQQELLHCNGQLLILLDFQNAELEKHLAKVHLRLVDISYNFEDLVCILASQK